MADYTITATYKTKFQVYVLGQDRFFGPEVDNMKEALQQWDIAKSFEPDVNWDIVCNVTKVIK